MALQATPESSPPESPRTPRPPKRGSTTSPGQEALYTGSRWLAALVCCHHKAELAADGLALLNDLVQLLYYHGSGVAHTLTVDGCDTSVHLLSPVVQVSLETHMCIPTRAKATQHFGATCSLRLWQVMSLGLPGMYHDKHLWDDFLCMWILNMHISSAGWQMHLLHLLHLHMSDIDEGVIKSLSTCEDKQTLKLTVPLLSFACYYMLLHAICR